MHAAMCKVNAISEMLASRYRARLNLPPELLGIALNGTDCSDITDANALVDEAHSELFYEEQTHNLQQNFGGDFVSAAVKPDFLTWRQFFNRLCHIQGFIVINRHNIDYPGFQVAYNLPLTDSDWRVTHWLYAAGKHIIPPFPGVSIRIEFKANEATFFSTTVIAGAKEYVARSIRVHLAYDHTFHGPVPDNVTDVTGIVTINGDTHSQTNLFVPNDQGSEKLVITYTVADTKVTSKHIIML